MATMQDRNIRETVQSPEIDFEVAQESSVEAEQEQEKKEGQSETVEQTQESEPIDSKEVSETPTVPPSTIQIAQKEPDLIQVENILAEDLTDVFLGMPDENKSAFKQKGEEVAQKIQVMITTGKVKVRSILDLIRDWLSLIPGVNKFFLEQESKIKTDRILAYVDQRRNAV